MSNYLSIEEAIAISGVSAEEFKARYINGGLISIQVNDGVKSVELSEFKRVFPRAQIKPKATYHELEVDNLLYQQKIDNLERQVAQLQRQLDKQFDEYDWLRGKFDNTTLLLEQKLDTSELDKYKQEIRQLSQQSVQWEKKYNTLLAASELKTLLKENRELKQQLEINSKELIANKVAAQVQAVDSEESLAAANINTSNSSDSSRSSDGEMSALSSGESLKPDDGEKDINLSPEDEIPPAIEEHSANEIPEVKPRRKIFGIF